MIHLGAPFRVNGASPLFSPMLLAPDPANDGTLDAREIMNLDLHASVAVLSDGASMTMRDAADEVGAVGWAWRAAGVPAIVLPRWAGDDAASIALLVTLHERLRAGDAPDIALQAARAKVRSGRGTGSPFYWAAWMLDREVARLRLRPSYGRCACPEPSPPSSLRAQSKLPGSAGSAGSAVKGSGGPFSPFSYPGPESQYHGRDQRSGAPPT